MNTITDNSLCKAMSLIYKSSTAREYIQTAIAGRNAKEIPAQELTDIITRAVELAKETP
jgi:hypothetical protein